MSDYTVLHVEEVPDPSGDYPGAIRFMTSALGCQQVAVTHRVVAPGAGGIMGRSRGHRHKTQEEVYFLVSGRVQVKLDDEVIELGPGTALRMAPEVVRSVYNHTDEDATLILISTSEVSAREDAEIVEDFWPE